MRRRLAVPRRDREPGGADDGAEGQTHVVERRAMEAVVEEVVKKGVMEVDGQMV